MGNRGRSHDRAGRIADVRQLRCCQNPEEVRDQLPDTLNLLATSLRAGYSLLQAVEAVGEEAPEPTRREFGGRWQRSGWDDPINDALDDIAERMVSQDFEWTVMAIGIQREVGGNLAEVLQTTSETMVQRNRLRREMKALTAEGRISAIVLAAAAIFLFAWSSPCSTPDTWNQ